MNDVISIDGKKYQRIKEEKEDSVDFDGERVLIVIALINIVVAIAAFGMEKFFVGIIAGSIAFSLVTVVVEFAPSIYKKARRKR